MSPVSSTNISESKRMCRGGVKENINTHTEGQYGEAYVTITKQDCTVTEWD